MTQTLDTPPASNGNGNQLANRLPQAPMLPPVTDDSAFANLMDAGRFGHMQRVAKLFACSQMVPQHFQGNESNCFIALQMSMRMGVDPFMFMQNTYIVHGRPGMEAKLAIALINSSGIFTDSIDFEVVGTDPTAPDYKVRATAVRKSTGKLITGPWIDWKIVKAERWDSKEGSKWKTMPGLMFQYRAATWFGRLHCPERLMGMQTSDELADTGELRSVTSTVVSSGAPFSRTRALAEKLGGGEQTPPLDPQAAAEGSQVNPDADAATESPGGAQDDAVEAPVAQAAPQAAQTSTDKPDDAEALEIRAREALTGTWDQVKGRLRELVRTIYGVTSKPDFEGGVFKFLTSRKLMAAADLPTTQPAAVRELYDAIVGKVYDVKSGAIVNPDAD